MKLKKGFVLRNVCGENVIIGEGLEAVNFGKLLALNETATWVWQQASDQGEFTIDSLTKALCEEYEVGEQQAQADVAKLVDEWQQVGVVE